MLPQKQGEALTLENKFQTYLGSPEKQTALYRRTLWIVAIAQIFSGAGLAAGITVGALLAQDMLGSDSITGVPAAMYTLGSALAAYVIGRLSQRHGRRLGLAAGFLTGGMGAIGVLIAAMTNNIFLLFAALFIYGSGFAANLQVRYAGTDLANANQRATAISMTLVASTFGAVAGPNLVNVMGNFAKGVGVPALAGPFILSAFVFLLAGSILFIFLRPDPLFVAKALTERENQQANTLSAPQEVNKRGIVVGAVVMILSQIVMVGIMTMTPVHMGHHGHDLGDVGLVIGIHAGSMFLPSLITGRLVDKIGRLAMAIASGITLLASGVVAAMAPPDSMIFITIALALLGLGWNLGLISGTALIVDSTSPKSRAKTQGSVDVFVALAGASGGALSGIIAAHTSFATLSLIGGFLSFLLVPVIIWFRKN
ncbi:MFS transporter [Pseudoneobacillus sp. C159]